MSTENKKYLDQTRFPKVVLPIEQNFKKGYEEMTKDLLKTLTKEILKSKDNDKA